MRFLIPATERHLIDDFFGDYGLANRSRSYIPAIEADEDGKNVYIKAELPGLDKKDIHVEYKDKILTISGEKTVEREDRKKDYYYSEISSGKFCRRLNVGNVDFENAEAEMKSGILKIALPKTKGVQAQKLAIK